MQTLHMSLRIFFNFVFYKYLFINSNNNNITTIITKNLVVNHLRHCSLAAIILIQVLDNIFDPQLISCSQKSIYT